MSWMSTYYWGPEGGGGGETIVVSDPEIIDTAEVVEVIDIYEDGVKTMSNTFVIFQGDTPKPRLVKFDTIAVADCTCRQVLRRSLRDTPEIDVEVTTKKTVSAVEYFHVYLTPAQTAALAPGDWLWIVELHASGTTPPIKREIHRKLKINSQASTT